MNIQNSIELCAYLTFVLLKKSDHSSGCGGKSWFTISFSWFTIQNLSVNIKRTPAQKAASMRGAGGKWSTADACGASDRQRAKGARKSGIAQTVGRSLNPLQLPLRLVSSTSYSIRDADYGVRPVARPVGFEPTRVVVNA